MSVGGEVRVDDTLAEEDERRKKETRMRELSWGSSKGFQHTR